VPLTEEAKQEARELMLSSRNLLKPATGDPVVTPTQDIVWGAFYMTVEHETKHGGALKVFSDPGEAILAYQLGHIALQEPIDVRMAAEVEESYRTAEGRIRTTAGRILFSRILPEGIPYPTQSLGKRALEQIVRRCIDLYEQEATVELLDKIKSLSLAYLTRSGLSWGRGDLPQLERKGRCTVLSLFPGILGGW